MTNTFKSINNVRPGSHRALAIKAISDGHDAGLNHEKICDKIFEAVQGNGGSISHSTKFGWYDDLVGAFRRPDGTELAPAAPPRQRRTRKAAENPAAPTTPDQAKEEATEGLANAAVLAAKDETGENPVDAEGVAELLGEMVKAEMPPEPSEVRPQ